MRPKTILPIILLILMSFAVTAWDETYAPTFEYDEGDWNASEPATQAGDYDYTDYGECNGYCFMMVNFTTNASGGYYDTAIFGTNFTDAVNGEDATSQPECWNNNQIRMMIILNTSDLENTWIGCSNASNPVSWLPYDDAYNASESNGRISGMYLYIDDVTPTVTLNYGIENHTKNCSEEYVRESDIIFEADDTTDTEMDCCVYVNDVEDTSSCNSSIQDETESVLHTDALGEGANTLFIRCEDETHWGDSSTMRLYGNACAECASNFLPDILEFAIIVALLIWIAAYWFGGMDYFAKNWWIIAAIIAAMFILWYLQNWKNLCG